jgi:N-acetylglutamate synthase-like GNAT family acetyltransferase
MRDITNLLAVINGYAANGIMLPRTEFEMSENIRDFSVALDGDALVGCGALHFYTPAIAEVRSLAVLTDIKQRGIGRAVVEALETEALENDLEAIFALLTSRNFLRSSVSARWNAASCRSKSGKTACAARNSTTAMRRRLSSGYGHVQRLRTGPSSKAASLTSPFSSHE